MFKALQFFVGFAIKLLIKFRSCIWTLEGLMRTIGPGKNSSETGGGELGQSPYRIAHAIFDTQIGIGHRRP